MKKIIFNILLYILLFTPLNAFGQSVETYLNEGFEAAKNQDFKLANKKFLKAQELSPYNPAILFNLGLANSKEGNELTAIAWFRAYLEADPNSPNKQQVENKIKNLIELNKAKREKIFQKAFDMAKTLPSFDWYEPVAYVLCFWEQSGNKENALKHINTLSYAPFTFYDHYKKTLYYNPEQDPIVADILELIDKPVPLKQEDYSYILSNLNKISAGHKRNKSFESIIDAIIVKGDLDGAYSLIKMTPKGEYLDGVAALINEFSLCRSNYNKALSLTEERYTADNRLRFIAEFQAKLGRFSDTVETIKKMKSDPLGTNYGKQKAILILAEAFIDAGHFEQAKLWSNEITNEYFLETLAVKFVKNGKYDIAQKIMTRVKDDENKVVYYSTISDFSNSLRLSQKATDNLDIIYTYGNAIYGSIKDKKEIDPEEILTDIGSYMKIAGSDPELKYNILKAIGKYFSRDKKYEQAIIIADYLKSKGYHYSAFIITHHIAIDKINKKKLYEAEKFINKYLYEVGVKSLSANETWIRLYKEYLKTQNFDKAADALGKAKVTAILSRNLVSLREIEKYETQLINKTNNIWSDKKLKTDVWITHANFLSNKPQISSIESLAEHYSSVSDPVKIPERITDIAVNNAFWLEWDQKIVKFMRGI